MFRRVIDTINRIAGSKPSEPESKPTHTREQLIQWATGCMWEGLPDSFYSAWVEYSRSASNEVSLSYKCILVEGSEVTTFQPADDLYPAQCFQIRSPFEQHAMTGGVANGTNKADGGADDQGTGTSYHQQGQTTIQPAGGFCYRGIAASNRLQSVSGLYRWHMMPNGEYF